MNFKELTVVEMKKKNTEHQILAEAQRENFHEELKVKKQLTLQKSATLLSLRPVLTNNVLCVGERVAQSFLSFNSK